MYCFRCGSKVEHNQKYCPHCGADILEELKRYSYPEQNNQKIESKIHPTSHEEQYVYSIKYSFGDEEELIKAYVGKNYEKIKNTKFSIPTFFFGPCYFFYRKLYALGLGYAIISIFLGSLAYPIFLIIHILLSATFSKLYLNIVKTRVEKIKQQNKNIDKEALKIHCKIKGGVNILVILIAIIVFFSLVVLTIVYVNKEVIDTEIKSSEITHKQKNSIGNISYTIPKGFEKTEYDNQNIYNIYIKNGYCSISFKINEYANFYETAQEYLNETTYTSQSDIVSPMDTITLNNKDWQHLTIQSAYRTENKYAMKTETTIYSIETSNNPETSDCDNYYQQILNSINYKE